MCYMLCRYGREIKVVHFAGPYKPWQYAYNMADDSLSDSDESGNVLTWWRIFCQHRHSMSPQNMVRIFWCIYLWTTPSVPTIDNPGISTLWTTPGISTLSTNTPSPIAYLLYGYPSGVFTFWTPLVCLLSGQSLVCTFWTTSGPVYILDNHLICLLSGQPPGVYFL